MLKRSKINFAKSRTDYFIEIILNERILSNFRIDSPDDNLSLCRDTSRRMLHARTTFPDSQRARCVLHHCARNAGLSVLKCQATDKPKALILRRGPHRGGVVHGPCLD